MPSLADRPLWDIFCTVVDNYGDIGVCWRLARQLASEHGLNVRLWVDELLPFKSLCPQVDPQHSLQRIEGVEIRHWKADFPDITSGSVVIEAFACHIPENFVAAMARCQRPPMWINLEYLSAEAWVVGCHRLSSPHPRLPLIKYFFFPGFTSSTGGLLRERDLIARRQDFETSAELEAGFWQQLGCPFRSCTDALRVSLFAYENPVIVDLLRAWEISATPICCFVPVSQALRQVETGYGIQLKAGDIVQRGALEIRVLPFVRQNDYDLLLWACDLNFVRGEDSFVRAQWAARPMVWHIYPQQENAHVAKLDAFLDMYCNDLPVAAAAVRRFWHIWNSGAVGACSASQWNEFAAYLPQLRQHATTWSEKLAGQEDLSTSLVRFCRTKL